MSRDKNIYTKTIFINTSFDRFVSVNRKERYQVNQNIENTWNEQCNFPHIFWPLLMIVSTFFTTFQFQSYFCFFIFLITPSLNVIASTSKFSLIFSQYDRANVRALHAALYLAGKKSFSRSGMRLRQHNYVEID